MSPTKTDRAKLLDQLLGARLPQLEAATAAQARLDAAAAAVDAAEAARRAAVDELRVAYQDAVAAGWTENDLATVGVEKPRRQGGRKTSGTGEQSGSDASADGK